MELFLVTGCLPSTFHRILGKHDQSSPMKKTLAKGRHLANHMFAEFPPCDTLQTHALPSFSHVAPGKQISPLFSSLFLFHFLFAFMLYSFYIICFLSFIFFPVTISFCSHLVHFQAFHAYNSNLSCKCMKKEKNELQIPICVLFLRGILFVFFTLCLGLILEKKKNKIYGCLDLNTKMKLIGFT